MAFRVFQFRSISHDEFLEDSTITELVNIIRKNMHVLCCAIRYMLMVILHQYESREGLKVSVTL